MIKIAHSRRMGKLFHLYTQK